VIYKVHSLTRIIGVTL